MTTKMNRIGALLTAACLLAAPLIGCSDGGDRNVDLSTIQPVKNPGFDPKAPTESAVQSNNGFAIDLYRQLAESKEADSNLLFSPVSISAALMLTYEGAKGETQAEFEQVLSLQDTDRLAAHKGYAGVLGRLSGDKQPYELSVANAVWTEQTLPLRDGFVDTLQSHYEAGFESVDFKGDYENQRKRINAWVSDRTHDRINDLLPERSLDDLTRLVLVNAIYFKAEWAMQFEEGSTQDQPFYLLPKQADAAGEKVSVPMMSQGMEHFRHADFDGYDALTLPYDRHDLAMVILLPDEKGGLAALEKRLSTEMIDATVSKMDRTLVNVWLPKWEMTLDYDLIPALKALGMTKAFKSDEADFTGISDSAEAERLYISKAFHKAFIAVDEAGTEAAAATAVVLAEESAFVPQSKPIDFRADHPFIYLIRDQRTGAILFIGRVTDPS